MAEIQVKFLWVFAWLNCVETLVKKRVEGGSI